MKNSFIQQSPTPDDHLTSETESAFLLLASRLLTDEAISTLPYALEATVNI